MNNNKAREDYNQSVKETLKRVEDTLIKKNAEYAGDKHPLHNFYASAELGRTTPVDIALSFQIKHLTSIIDMIKNNAETGELYLEALWNEKLTDAINYFVLIKAIIDTDKEFYIKKEQE